jgi:high-affinity nickel-transport protein
MTTTTDQQDRRLRGERGGTVRPTKPALLVVALLHVVGGVLVVVATSTVADAGYVVGLGVTAYLLGARHAFDADHIAAIDNATRKLSFESRPSSTVGFWFSLGHSTVVIATVALLLVGVGVFFDAVNDEQSALRQALGYWGATVSLAFVIVFGCLNLVGLLRLTRSRRRGGTATDTGSRSGVAAPVSMLLRPFAHLVDRPARMYIVGLLFGLGFDTAATIGLFVTAGAASAAVSWQIAVAMPLLFTAGMCLFDFLDGMVMTRMYAWSGAREDRRRRYDIVITALSVAAAFVVAAISVVTLSAELSGSSFELPAPADWLGFAIVAVFLLTWLLAALSRAALSRRRHRPHPAR